VGVAAMLSWQVVVNIGMVTGLLPVVGVTLPLLSYGGSSALTVMLALGLVMNVSVRRFAY
jgi:rod shape determining protein RodA